MSTHLWDDDIPLTPHDHLALRYFGVTRQWAHDQGVCIRCRRDVAGLEGRDHDEYRLSALCPECFLAMTPEDET